MAVVQVRLKLRRQGRRVGADQQACLFAALPRLAANEPITQIAFELGYESPAAFTTMFKRLQGVPPSLYLTKLGAEQRR